MAKQRLVSDRNTIESTTSVRELKAYPDLSGSSTERIVFE